MFKINHMEIVLMKYNWYRTVKQSVVLGVAVLALTAMQWGGASTCQAA